MCVASRAWDEFGVHRLRALNAPLLIDSYALQERVLTSDLVAPILAELRKLDLEKIAILPRPMRHPLGFGQRLATPADFNGLRIGVQQSRVADAFMRALGARPVRLPARIPSNQGLDGVELQAVAIDGARLDSKGSDLMINVDLWPRALVLFASTKSIRTLTEAQRRIIATAAMKAVPLATKLTRTRRNRGCRQHLPQRERGVRIRHACGSTRAPRSGRARVPSARA